MWSRWQLKENAKAVLRRSYWKAFLVGLLFTLATTSYLLTYNFDEQQVNSLFGETSDPLVIIFLSIFVFFIIYITSIAATLISILVLNPLEIGVQRYYLESTQMRFNLSEISFGFSCGKYRNIAATMLLRNIYLTLWSLLLIIPGIVKLYQYAMVPFLLAENPALSPTRAIQISMDITMGHKWRMFVLDLSFIGWYLLGILALAIGTLFVTPYYCSTRAQLYLALRAAALDRGILSLAELESYQH